MPKVDIDYSNTIFYKIFCKDSSIKDLYVGLTTNFVQRRHSHKQSCKNEKAMNHNCKLYNTIRNSGGWDNWQMEIIAFHNCADSYEARKKEHEYFEKLGATLNSIDPLPKPKIKESVAKILQEKSKLFCEPCKVYFDHWKAQDTHNDTKKHHKLVATFNHNNLNINKPQEIPLKYTCDNCNYCTVSSKDYNKHLLTRKHQNRTKLNVLDQNVPNKSQLFECECGKNYTARNSLWYHKKKCTLQPFSESDEEYSSTPTTELSEKDLIMMIVKQNAELIKENNEFKTMMMKVLENGTNNTHPILI
jgi:hypothetical protein